MTDQVFFLPLVTFRHKLVEKWCEKSVVYNNHVHVCVTTPMEENALDWKVWKELSHLNRKYLGTARTSRILPDISTKSYQISISTKLRRFKIHNAKDQEKFIDEIVGLQW
uniref:Uncharacterized protein n=1 Tax=Cacopsylla melanoneura TaxID=428564 RepID=A0A8D8QY55_9HEMI